MQSARTELLYQVTDALNYYLFRSSHSQMFFKIDVLKNFANFTGKHLCWSLFSIQLQALRPASLLKRDFNMFDSNVMTYMFSCEICEIFKIIFFYRTPPVAASIYYKMQFSKVLTKIFLECTLPLTFPGRFTFLLYKTPI